VRLWKEVLIIALVAGVALKILEGTVVIRRNYGLAFVLWVLFFFFLLMRAPFDGNLLASAYAIRVYAEPLLAGLCIGIVFRAHVRVEKYVRILSVAMIVIALVGVAQVALPFSPLFVALRRSAADVFGDLPNAFTVSILNQFRPFATFSDPNDFGFFAVIVLVLCICVGAGSRRLSYSASIFALTALAISFSRSALLAGVVGLAAAVTLQILYRPEVAAAISSRILIATSVLVLSGAVILFLVGREIPQLSHIANTLSQADPSAQGHVRSIVEGFGTVLRFPEGFGLGLVGPRAGLYGGAQKLYHVESSYLQIALEAGLPAILLYALAMLATLTASWIDAASIGAYRQLGIAVTVVLAAAIGAYIFLPTIVSLQTGTLIWAVVGMASVEKRHRSYRPALLAPERDL
jgi:hypothetical protein